MLLAIDCGNTNTVFSIWDGARFLATWRLATSHARTADDRLAKYFPGEKFDLGEPVTL